MPSLGGWKEVQHLLQLIESDAVLSIRVNERPACMVGRSVYLACRSSARLAVPASERHGAAVLEEGEAF
jgi:hypothetical protein